MRAFELRRGPSLIVSLGCLALALAGCGSSPSKSKSDASISGASDDAGPGSESGGTGGGSTQGSGGKGGSGGSSGASGTSGQAGRSSSEDAGMSSGGGEKKPKPEADSGMPDAGGPSNTTVGPASTTKIGSKGGTITVKTQGGDDAAEITIPSGAFTGDTDVTVGQATLPSSAPSTVGQITPGVSIDLGGDVFRSAATVRLRLPYNPADGELLIVSYSPKGTIFIKYMLKKSDDGSTTYAEFTVTQGGEYLAVKLIPKSGCDQTLATAPTVSKQADVDALEKVSRIVGQLSISGTAITSLANLKCLQQVDGILISNTGITSLEGLEQLTFVGRDNYYYGVSITNNAKLESGSLPSLTAIGNQAQYSGYGLSIQTNPVLASFSADALNASSITFTGNSRAATGVSLSLKALEVSPAVAVTDNPSLMEIDGFGALVDVDGAVNVTNNGITNLDGFESLESTGGLTISNNVALTSADGLSKLTTANAITISNNQLLTSIPLKALTTVAQPTTGVASIAVSANSALKSFSAPALTSLDGGFTFSQNGNATDATTLDLGALGTVAGTLSITQNLGLQALDGLKALTTTGDFTITNNASLKNVSGFGKLDTVNNLSVSNNAKLTDLGGLSKLTYANGVAIGSNAALTTAELPALNSVTSTVSVTSNAALTSFAADALHVAPQAVTFTSNGTAGKETKISMKGLSSVTGAFSVDSNQSLVDLSGFSALVSVGQAVEISGNDGLTSLTGLSKLATITGALTVSQNKLLTDLNALSALNRVTGAISIANNAALTDVTLPALTSASGVAVNTNAALTNIKIDALTGVTGNIQVASDGTAASVSAMTISMAALTTIGGSLLISSNPKLTTLNGFPMLSGIHGSYSVTSNVLLPTCNAVSLRNDVMTKGTIGSSNISGNLSDSCVP